MVDPSRDGVSDLDVVNEALQTIANDRRLQILTVLGDACEGGSYGNLRYSRVLDRTDISDSGKFNYHLQQLVAQGYVEQVDDGYQLTLRGLKAYQAVKSGFYADDVEVEPFEVGVSHPHCGNAIYAKYETQRLVIFCPSCEDTIHQYPVPPGPLGEVAAETLLDAFEVRFSVDLISMARGFCPYCSGRVEMDLSETNYEQMDVHDWDAPAPLFWCTHCRWFAVFTLDRLLKHHPLVSAFFFERGLDVWETYGWREETTVDDRVRSRDPLEISLTFEYEGDVLELVVDDALDVIESEERTTDAD